MFKKWLDLDVKAYRSAKLNAAENLERVNALHGGPFNRSALDEMIAGLVEAVKPRLGKSIAALHARRWLKQSPGSV